MAQAVTKYEQGQAAARAWLDEGGFSHREPANPYARGTFAARAWSEGFGSGCYAEFGDPSRDMERLERAFGA
jgi:hypothetical protein